MVGCEDTSHNPDIIDETPKTETEPEPNTPEETEYPVPEVCTISLFEYAPVNMEKTKVFLPLGLMTGSHVTPIDHHYFQNFENQGYNIEIYSPAAGVITDIQHMPGAPMGEDYRVVIDHGCGVSSVYIHLGTFADQFEELAPELSGKEYHRVNVEVEAGELIGYYETNVDYNIVDTNFLLTGFVNPESYVAESWKFHIPNTYDYFTEEIKEQLIAISIRTADPIQGKIDYDIKGKLVGNWFLEGTNGYAGNSTETEGYWMGHLAIAYDAYDPTRIVFSIGGYLGENSRQLAVQGNTPDPAEVSKETGIVKYIMVPYDYVQADGSHWDRISLPVGLSTVEYDYVDAIVLVEVIDDYTIKFELFFDVDVEEVTTFTENHLIYKR